MNWSKYTIENRFIPGTTILALIFIVISIYLQSKLVFFLACFFLMIVYANQLYLRKAGVGLSLVNDHERNHFFIEENGKWSLIFVNKSYPILNGEIRVFFDEYVAPMDGVLGPKRAKYEIVVPISLFTNQKKKISIPFQAKHRGIARIRTLEFHIPSLIGFGQTVLEYRPMILQEAVVYPKRIPVKGLKEKTSQTQGINIVPFSVYEDRLGPLGTRDYLPTDSFNRIHWKASARKQTLQTKIFERIAEKSWVVSLNVSDGYGYHQRLEQLISSVAEFAYFAAQTNLPYSLCVNVRMAGSTPFLFIPMGEGKEHLQRVLAALSSINQTPSYPYERMLSFLSKHMTAPAFFLHAGLRTEPNDAILFRLGNSGANLFELEAEEEYGVFSPINFHKERRMTL